jgi:hypothetical protein
MRISSVVLLCVVPISAMTQTIDRMDVTSKLNYHLQSVGSPLSLMESAAYAGILQGLDTPKEWSQGAAGYGERFASTVGASAIHATLAFGLDSTLHQDPRYFRSRDAGFWRRTAHVLRGTILTHTDRGSETLATWRLGSAYGAAFLSNEWYPDRLNTVRLGLVEGSLHLGFDFAGNFASEFWPDLKRKFTRPKNVGGSICCQKVGK